MYWDNCLKSKGCKELGLTNVSIYGCVICHQAAFTPKSHSSCIFLPIVLKILTIVQYHLSIIFEDGLYKRVLYVGFFVLKIVLSMTDSQIHIHYPSGSDFVNQTH